MKKIIPALLILISLSACNFSNEREAREEARNPVQLSPDDLAVFAALKQQLVHDSAAIRKQNDKTTAPPNRNNWLSTNSYYLNQINFEKYNRPYTKLAGKFVDDITLSRKGGVVFKLKETVRENFGNYNETYTHFLISRDCNCPPDKIYSIVDSVFVDSIIDKDWRYVSAKELTGH